MWAEFIFRSVFSIYQLVPHLLATELGVDKYSQIFAQYFGRFVLVLCAWWVGLQEDRGLLLARWARVSIKNWKWRKTQRLMIYDFRSFKIYVYANLSRRYDVIYTLEKYESRALRYFSVIILIYLLVTAHTITVLLSV